MGTSKGNSVSDAALAGRAKYFTYIAYNEEGTEVSRIKQDSTGYTIRLNDSIILEGFEIPLGRQTFGCIKDTLPAGSYTIVMLASNARYSINNRNETNIQYEYLPLADASFYYTRGLDVWSVAGDTFFKKFSLSVTAENATHNVTLDRIVGKAEINILDSRPGTVFKFLFINDFEAYKFSNEQPFNQTYDADNEQLLPSIPGREKLSYSKFLLNTIAPLDVIIKVYENGNLSATKTVKDVRFYKNKRTVLTGHIYSEAAASTGFSVKVNDQFDPDSIVVKF
jgi:hypothetical protein